MLILAQWPVEDLPELVDAKIEGLFCCLHCTFVYLVNTLICSGFHGIHRSSVNLVLCGVFLQVFVITHSHIPRVNVEGIAFAPDFLIPEMGNMPRWSY